VSDRMPEVPHAPLTVALRCRYGSVRGRILLFGCRDTGHPGRHPMQNPSAYLTGNN